jgi:hypothetical protein
MNHAEDMSINQASRTYDYSRFISDNNNIVSKLISEERFPIYFVSFRLTAPDRSSYDILLQEFNLKKTAELLLALESFPRQWTFTNKYALNSKAAFNETEEKKVVAKLHSFIHGTDITIPINEAIKNLSSKYTKEPILKGDGTLYFQHKGITRMSDFGLEISLFDKKVTYTPKNVALF